MVQMMMEEAEMNNSDMVRFEKQNQLSDPIVYQKYQDAGAVAKEALTLAMNLIQTSYNAVIVAGGESGSKVSNICNQVDAFIEEKCKSLFTYDCERGIAFPCTISCNETVRYGGGENNGHCWMTGDLVKIELGVHVDGYIATLAHSMILGQHQPSCPVQGAKADAVCAALLASQVVARMLRPGQKLGEISELIGRVARRYNCLPVKETYSSQMKRFVLDARKVIYNDASSSSESSSEDDVVAANDVYAINIVMVSDSSRPSQPKERGDQTSVRIFQRNVSSQRTQLRLKASRTLYSQVDRHYPVFPFNLARLEEKMVVTVASSESSAVALKLGLPECLKHGLLVAHPEISESKDRAVAQFKFTVLVGSGNGEVGNGSGSNQVICGIESFPIPFVHSVYDLEDDAKIQAIMTSQ